MQGAIKKKRCLNIYLIFTILLILSLPLLALDEDATRFRGSSGDGIFTMDKWNPSVLDKNPDILWQKEVGYGYAAVSVKGNFLYTAGNNKNKDTVYCLDVQTGKEIWSYTYDSKQGEYRGPYATPVLDDGFVYTISKDGELICFNAANGKVQWQKSIKKNFSTKGPKWGIAGSPVIDGDRLLLNELTWGMALQKKTGETIWQSSKGTGGYATPVLYSAGDKRCAAIFGEKALYGVDTATGRKLWEYPWAPITPINAADPLVAGNQFFISSNYGKGCALIEINNNKPTEVWKNKLISSHFNSFIYRDGYIYGNDGDAIFNKGILRCLDIKTGKEAWNKNLGLSSLVALNNYLVLLTSRGKLYVINATHLGYSEVSSCKLPSGTYWTAPVIARGKLFCRSTKGNLVCINIGN